ncbi:hypothetical protein SLA2020_057920 [Shorea laevis]
MHASMKCNFEQLMDHVLEFVCSILKSDLITELRRHCSIGNFLDIYFTQSFHKQILGVKVTYQHIEDVDPENYKNLKWLLENNLSDIPDLTFSMDTDE